MLVEHEDMDQAEADMILQEAGKICGEDNQLDFDEFVLLVETLEA